MPIMSAYIGICLLDHDNACYIPILHISILPSSNLT